MNKKLTSEVDITSRKSDCKFSVEYWKSQGIAFYDEIPEGWAVCKGTLTEPRGYVWIDNKASLFDGTRKKGLIKKEKIKN